MHEVVGRIATADCGRERSRVLHICLNGLARTLVTLRAARHCADGMPGVFKSGAQTSTHKARRTGHEHSHVFRPITEAAASTGFPATTVLRTFTVTMPFSIVSAIPGPVRAVRAS